jgi:hypothetical protein
LRDAFGDLASPDSVWTDQLVRAVRYAVDRQGA